MDYVKNGSCCDHVTCAIFASFIFVDVAYLLWVTLPLLAALGWSLSYWNDEKETPEARKALWAQLSRSTLPWCISYELIQWYWLDIQYAVHAVWLQCTCYTDVSWGLSSKKYISRPNRYRHQTSCLGCRDASTIFGLGFSTTDKVNGTSSLKYRLVAFSSRVWYRVRYNLYCTVCTPHPTLQQIYYAWRHSGTSWRHKNDTYEMSRSYTWGEHDANYETSGGG